MRVPNELTSPKPKRRTCPPVPASPHGIAALALEKPICFVICLDANFKSAGVNLCLLAFVCLKWTVLEEGRSGGGRTMKIVWVVKMSCILCMSSGDQIFIFSLASWNVFIYVSY